MRLTRIYSLILCLALGLTIEVHAESTYMQIAEKADSAIVASDWTLAEALLQQAIDLEPENPTNVLLLSNLGIVRHNAGKHVLAIEALDKALAVAPASVTVLGNRARIHTYCNNIESALADYNKIMYLDSTLTEPIFMHGMLSLQSADLEAASTDFARLSKMAPNDVNTHIGLATLNVAKGELRQAIKEYTTIIAIDSAAEWRTQRASLYLALGDLNEASEDIAEAMRLDPDDAELYLMRAVLNKKRFRPDEAKADAQKAVELGIDPSVIKEMGF